MVSSIRSAKESIALSSSVGGREETATVEPLLLSLDAGLRHFDIHSGYSFRDDQL
jgi:hypothetical protein